MTMRYALANLTRAAEARAAELRALAQHADDRGAQIVEPKQRRGNGSRAMVVMRSVVIGTGSALPYGIRQRYHRCSDRNPNGDTAMTILFKARCAYGRSRENSPSRAPRG